MRRVEGQSHRLFHKVFDWWLLFTNHKQRHRPLIPGFGPETPRILCHQTKTPWHSIAHKRRGRIGGAAKREEVVPTDSQFLQAQGLLTSFVLKYKGPGHIIPQMWRENWRCREAGGGRTDRQPISPSPGTSYTAYHQTYRPWAQYIIPSRISSNPLLYWET